MLKNVLRPYRRQLLLLAAFMLLTAAAPLLAPHDPGAQKLADALLPPGGSYPLGTDQYGRCILSRVLQAAPLSVFAAAAAVLISCCAGSAAGLCSGWNTGFSGRLALWLTEIFLSLPGLITAMALASVYDSAAASVLALSLAGWAKYARLMRARVLAVRRTPYIEAAMISGCSGRNMLLRQLLPEAAGPVLIMAALDMGTVILEFSTLSFLNLGVQPPAAEWGLMISSARSLLLIAPWTVLAPGAALLLTAAFFTFLGDSVRGIFDKRPG